MTHDASQRQQAESFELRPAKLYVLHRGKLDGVRRNRLNAAEAALRLSLRECGLSKYQEHRREPINSYFVYPSDNNETSISFFVDKMGVVHLLNFYFTYSEGGGVFDFAAALETRGRRNVLPRGIYRPDDMAAHHCSWHVCGTYVPSTAGPMGHDRDTIALVSELISSLFNIPGASRLDHCGADTAAISSDEERVAVYGDMVSLLSKYAEHTADGRIGVSRASIWVSKVARSAARTAFPTLSFQIVRQRVLEEQIQRGQVEARAGGRVLFGWASLMLSRLYDQSANIRYDAGRDYVIRSLAWESVNSFIHTNEQVYGGTFGASRAVLRDLRYVITRGRVLDSDIYDQQEWADVAGASVSDAQEAFRAAMRTLFVDDCETDQLARLPGSLDLGLSDALRRLSSCRVF